MANIFLRAITSTHSREAAAALYGLNALSASLPGALAILESSVGSAAAVHPLRQVLSTMGPAAVDQTGSVLLLIGILLHLAHRWRQVATVSKWLEFGSTGRQLLQQVAASVEALPNPVIE